MPLEAIGGVGTAGGSPPNPAKNLNSGLAGGCLGQPRCQKLIFYHPSYAFWLTQGAGGCRCGPLGAVGGFGTAAVSPPNLSQKSEFDSLWRPSGPRWRLPWPAQTPKIDFYYPSHAFWPTPGGRWTAVVSPRTPLTPLRNLNSEVSGDHLGLAGGCLG